MLLCVKKPVKVFTLPMRNGNLLKMGVCDLRVLVFTLPMRNGNFE